MRSPKWVPLPAQLPEMQLNAKSTKSLIFSCTLHSARQLGRGLVHGLGSCCLSRRCGRPRHCRLDCIMYHPVKAHGPWLEHREVIQKHESKDDDELRTDHQSLIYIMIWNFARYLWNIAISMNLGYRTVQPHCMSVSGGGYFERMGQLFEQLLELPTQRKGEEGWLLEMGC